VVTPIETACRSAIGTTGYTSSSSQRIMYSRSVGPGMFETVRLKERGLAIIRETAWRTCRGVWPKAFRITSAPSGTPSCLRLHIARCTSLSRRTGFDSSQGRSTNTNEIWLPRPASPPWARRFTGTIVFSLTGVSPRSSRKRRIPPAVTASTTSFTVVPKQPPISRSSSRGRCSTARWRCGEIGSLNTGDDVAGLSDCAAARTVWAPRCETAARRLGCRARRSGAPATSIASPKPPTTASASRRELGGVGPGCQPTRRGPGGSGVGSTSSAASSTAAMPSTMQWCTFPTTPMRPSSRVSATHTSQRGRFRARGVDMTLSTTSPNRERGDRRTCRPTSNCSSSTQTGSPTPSGTSASFCRYRGAPPRRPSM
jgi:hypothetical protein